MQNPYKECRIPTRNAESLQGMQNPYKGCRIPTRDAESLKGITESLLGIRFPIRLTFPYSVLSLNRSLIGS